MSAFVNEFQDDSETAVVRIYVDTQYTNMQTPRLISIGFASGAGNACYVELSDGWEKNDCSEYTIKNVLPYLGRNQHEIQSREDAADTIIQWSQSAFDIAMQERTGKVKLPAHVTKVVEFVALHSLDLELMAGLPEFFSKIKQIPCKVRYASITTIAKEGLNAEDVLNGIQRFFTGTDDLLPRHNAMNGALALNYGVKFAELKASNQLYQEEGSE